MRWWAPLAVAAVLALTGCGGSRLSTSALRTRAARVCSLANARAERIRPPTRPDQGTTFLEQGARVLQPELRALSKLHPGGQATHVYATALQAVQRELSMVTASAESLRHGGDPVIAVKTLQRQLAPIEARENAAFQTLEIPACAAR